MLLQARMFFLQQMPSNNVISHLKTTRHNVYDYGMRHGIAAAITG